MTHPAVFFLKHNPEIRQRRRTAVSLHGHTLHSRECLGFIPRLSARVPLLDRAIARQKERYRQCHGAELDLSRGWWTPPISAIDAYRLEARQIETTLGLAPLVSLSDHDNIHAASMLHLLQETAHAPFSVEWTVPFGPSFFHLGIHNLPAEKAHAAMGIMAGYTARPKEYRLAGILEWIASWPETLIVFNHPLWDEPGIGQEQHEALVSRFVQQFRRFLHAMELNGLRSRDENTGVIGLAGRYGIPLISGGDRHAHEPNACVNLTDAATFAEFVGEVREDSRSEVLFLPQYEQPLRVRFARSICDVLREHPHHSLGWVRWTDRVFYQGEDGVERSLAQLWGAHPPAVVRGFIALMHSVDVLGSRLSPAFRQSPAGIRYSGGVSKTAGESAN